MLKIRLKRIGKRKQAHFRVVVQEARSKAGGKHIDDLGFWNPHQDIFQVDEEKVKDWLSKGAKPTDTVHNFLVDKGVLEGPKIKKVRVKKREEEKKETSEEKEIEVSEKKEGGEEKQEEAKKKEKEEEQKSE